jgi:hypothetical protein
VHTHELPARRLSSDEQEEKGPGGSSEEGRWAGEAEHVEDTGKRIVRTKRRVVRPGCAGNPAPEDREREHSVLTRQAGVDNRIENSNWSAKNAPIL